jgi:hypothetical protein
MKRGAVLVMRGRTSENAQKGESISGLSTTDARISLSSFCCKTESTDAAVSTRNEEKAAGRVGKSGSAYGCGRRMESGGTKGPDSRAHTEGAHCNVGQATKARWNVDGGARRLGHGRRALMFGGWCNKHRTSPTRRVSEE